MEYPIYFDSKNSLNLYGLKKDFEFLSSLYSKKRFPKILMLTGSRGCGKATLINHFLYSIFDKKNYNDKLLNLSESSSIYKQFKNNIFQNIVNIKGSDFKSVKVEDIRNLKSKILQTSFSDKDRFIILDDIELFNINSLNALLKIIEEPGNNYFVLINNKTKPLIDTIKSRAIEIKIILKEKNRIEIINQLIKLYNIKTVLDPEISKLTPGNFLKFNYISKEYDISENSEFIDNLSLLLNLFKKNKDTLFIDMIFYLANFYFKSLKNKNIAKDDRILELKTFILDNLDKYLKFNLNHNSLINAINSKINHA